MRTAEVLVMVSALVVAGCRTAARVREVPRVDLALEKGNRGYLVGRPPETAELNTTRQMLEADVELPSAYKAKRSRTSITLDQVSPPEVEPLPTQGAPASYDTYVLQKGDSLWSIAAKPEIYGSATRWRDLYEANRELLKSPDRVRPGMTLKIPRGSAEPTTYKK